MRKPRVNVIVPCTSRKTVAVEYSAQLREISEKNLKPRVEEWFYRLSEIRIGCRSAFNMYCGSAWTPVTKIVQSLDIDVWIISAGYGLLHHSDVIVPYAATFSSPHPDSVTMSKTFQSSDWWMQCCKSHKIQRSVKTISDLAKQNPEVPILIAVSKPYLEAVESDICSARSLLVASNLLSIVSVGSTKGGILADNLLPCDTRMEQVIGLGRSSINTRILGTIIQEHNAGFDYESIKLQINKLQFHQTQTSYPVRSRMTDEEVLNFIIKSRDGNNSFTSMLTNLRSLGYACEYRRFKKLHQLSKIK